MKVFISQFLLIFAVILLLNSSIRPSINASSTITEPSFDSSELEGYLQQKKQKRAKPHYKPNPLSHSRPFLGKARQGDKIIEKHATFQIVGERIHVRLPKNKRVMIALENLTLERIHKYVGRVEDRKTWEVEGVVTEYEGQNYLLIHRAIVNSLELE